MAQPIDGIARYCENAGLSHYPRAAWARSAAIGQVKWRKRQLLTPRRLTPVCKGTSSRVQI